MSPEVAVVGAAGYVGRVLMRQLGERGIRATAVVRGAPELSVEGSFHNVIGRLEARHDEAFDVVVNLAYPTAGAGYEYREQNEAIARTIERLIRKGGRLIQVSTLAVFGLALDRAVNASAVQKIRDDAYVEAKIEAEHAFVEQQRRLGLSLYIVRLGNIWGRASGSWAVPLVQKLASGRPVGTVGEPGFSNTTDVENVASYLSLLIESGREEAGVHYHHLAEFSRVPWTDWIAPIAEAMGVEPVLAPRAVVSETTGLREVAGALASLKPRTLYRNLAAERVTGSWTRSLVGNLPAPARTRFKSSLVFAQVPEISRPERTFLDIMAGRQEFASVVDSGWRPRVTKDQSLSRVLKWLERD